MNKPTESASQSSHAPSSEEVKPYKQLVQTGAAQYQQKNYQQALATFLQAEPLIKAKHGTEHKAYATCQANIGQVYKALLNYSEAHKYFSECVRIRVKLFGAEHQKVKAIQQQVSECARFIQPKESKSEINRDEKRSSRTVVGRTLAQKIAYYIQQVQAEILTSNNIADRTTYPYFHNHSSVPTLLTAFKMRLAFYRQRISEMVAQFAPFNMPEVPQQLRDLAIGTFAHSFVGALAVSPFGLGDCAECAFRLAFKLIHAGYSNMAFIAILFTKAAFGMETNHQIIVTNLPTLPQPPKQELSLYEFFAILPADALVADAYLELCFSPREIPPAFTRYIDAYGGQTTIIQCFHLYNFSPKSLQQYLLVARCVELRMQQMLALLKEDEYDPSQRIEIPNTTIINLLNAKTPLRFSGVRDDDYQVDAIAELKSEADQAAAKKLQASLKGYGRFFGDGLQRKFVLEGVNTAEGNPSIRQRICACLTA